MNKINARERLLDLMITFRCAYLNTDGQVVLPNRLVIERFVDLDISPSELDIRALLEVKIVILVRLRCASFDERVINCRVVLDSRPGPPQEHVSTKLRNAQQQKNKKEAKQNIVGEQGALNLKVEMSTK
jgi:hypothetical protein